MKKAIVFVTYHPGALYRCEHIGSMCKDKFTSILIACWHPYSNSDIIGHYAGKFDHVIMLPDLKYELNVVRMGSKIKQFIVDFKRQLDIVLSGIDSFYIVSNSSAYLPVNILLSRLRRNTKCAGSIKATDDADRVVVDVRDVDVLRTAYYLLCSMIFGMYPVYHHKKLYFLYFRDPVDKVLMYKSPYVPKRGSMRRGDGKKPVYDMPEPAGRRSDRKKETVIIYGDTNVYGEPGTDLPREVYNERLSRFFRALAKYYSGCRLIYKPHPLDNGKIMPGLEGVGIELYEGRLISQLHLDMNSDDVRACYSVASTSLLYSASRGVPSYAFYGFVGYKREYPRVFFENEDMKANPFLYTISRCEEIGAIDSRDVVPIEAGCSEGFVEWMTA